MLHDLIHLFIFQGFGNGATTYRQSNAPTDNPFTAPAVPCPLPNVADVTYDMITIATDALHRSTHVNWELTVTENYGPVANVDYVYANDTVTAGDSFSFTHSANLFYDCDDGIDSVYMVSSNAHGQ